MFLFVLPILHMSEPPLSTSCSFLAKRGVKEDIATFEARNITPEIRRSVEELLHVNKSSFEPKVRKQSTRINNNIYDWWIFLTLCWFLLLVAESLYFRYLF